MWFQYFHLKLLELTILHSRYSALIIGSVIKSPPPTPQWHPSIFPLSSPSLPPSCRRGRMMNGLWPSTRLRQSRGRGDMETGNIRQTKKSPLFSRRLYFGSVSEHDFFRLVDWYCSYIASLLRSKTHDNDLRAISVTKCTSTGLPAYSDTLADCH